MVWPQRQRAVERANDSRRGQKPYQKKRSCRQRVRRRREVGRSDRTAELDRISSSARRIFSHLWELGRTRGAGSFREYKNTMRSPLTPAVEKARRIADIRYVQSISRSSKKPRDRPLDGAFAYLFGGRVLEGHLRRHLERIKAAREANKLTDDEGPADDEPVDVETRDSSSDDDGDGDNGPGAAGLAIGVAA